MNSFIGLAIAAALTLTAVPTFADCGPGEMNNGGARIDRGQVFSNQWYIVESCNGGETRCELLAKEIEAQGATVVNNDTFGNARYISMEYSYGYGPADSYCFAFVIREHDGTVVAKSDGPTCKSSSKRGISVAIKRLKWATNCVPIPGYVEDKERKEREARVARLEDLKREQERLEKKIAEDKVKAAKEAAKAKKEATKLEQEAKELRKREAEKLRRQLEALEEQIEEDESDSDSGSES